MANTPIYNMTDTWNAGATTFNAIKMSVTDTASASGSLLLDLLVGGSSKFSVSKAGNVAAAGTLTVTGASTLAALGATNGTFSGTLSVTGAATFSAGIERCGISSGRVAIGDAARARGASDVAIGFNAGGGTVADVNYTGNTNTCVGSEAGEAITSGWNNVFVGYRAGKEVTTGARNTLIGASLTGISTGRGNVIVGNDLNVDSGTSNWQINIGNRYFHNRIELAPANTSPTQSTADCILLREAANALAMRNGVNAQTLRLYNTYTDASNYERGIFAWDSNVLKLGTEKAGTGVARALELQTDGTTRVSVLTNGRVGIGTTNPARALHVVDGEAWGRIDRIGGTGPGWLLARLDSQGGVLSCWLTGPTNFAGASTDDYAIIDYGTAVGGAGGTLRLTIGKSDGQVTLYGNLNISTKDLVTDTTTGTKIGTGTTQKIGFYNATPVVQPAVVADPSGVTTDEDVEARAAINAIIDRLQDLGLMATS